MVGTSREPKNGGPGIGRASPGGTKRRTVAELEGQLRDTREELEHVKQAQAGLMTKLEKLEERIAEVANQPLPAAAEQVPPSGAADRLQIVYERNIRPGLAELAKFWSMYRQQIVTTVIVIAIIAWLLSWDVIFNFFFTLIMFAVFAFSLKFAGDRFLQHYRDAQQRLTRR